MELSISPFPSLSKPHLWTPRSGHVRNNKEEVIYNAYRGSCSETSHTGTLTRFPAPNCEKIIFPCLGDLPVVLCYGSSWAPLVLLLCLCLHHHRSVLSWATMLLKVLFLLILTHPYAEHLDKISRMTSSCGWCWEYIPYKSFPLAVGLYCMPQFSSGIDLVYSTFKYNNKPYDEGTLLLKYQE